MQFLQRVMPFLIAGSMMLSLQAGAAPVEGTQKQQAAVASENTMIVDLNTASLEELETLKGIGASKAQAIVAYRTEQGKFSSVEDLGKVKGFSEKILKKLMEQNPGRMKVSP